MAKRSPREAVSNCLSEMFDCGHACTVPHGTSGLRNNVLVETGETATSNTDATPTVISSRRVLLADSRFHPARIEMVGGRIRSIAPLSAGETPSCESMLVPGFVDVQVNGIEDVDVWAMALDRDVSAWQKISDYLLDQGVTSWCPTLVTAPLEHYRPALDFLREVAKDGQGRARSMGVHLEGPFLGTAPGAHRVELICNPDAEWMERHLDGVALLTMGAESVGAPRLAAMARTFGAAVSIGHSRPTRPQFSALVDAGAGLVTHLFNAMSGTHHREPGLAAWALIDSRVCASLIADGVHVAPEMIALAFAAKPGGMVLVTDAVAVRSNRVGSWRLSVIDGAPRLDDGTLAGSVSTMPEALSACVRSAGVPVVQAVRAATFHPARVLGRFDRGQLQSGCLADVVALKDDCSIAGVWLSGRQVR